ncbi:Protein CBR-SRE-36 [Caenorhabditis briggsae]|uniref:Protein CBR-SRE-36 n=1 Tax=Caenorhabditis briggsae TaxID=6238 RepID=A8Y3B3_CAEBR|nr:Protein CBR-SRE-36 [Caenorhabditis briggsae]CAP39382.2 Protein CBR-SRE-36 [Caenorhabditis briggsae]
MNILLWNSIDIWIPSYVFNDNSYISWSNFPYFLLIFLTIFTCFSMCFFMIFIFFECRKFHKNATYLLASMYVSWFECFLATLIILPYKYGIIHLAEPDHIFEGFEDLDNYLQLDELNLKSIPVLIASFMEWHYLGIVNSAFSCFLLERTLATVLFK